LTEPLTDDEIFLLKDVADWWRKARINSLENLAEKEKDHEALVKWVKVIDMLKAMKVGIYDER
jgi:hypothetical protein